MSAAQESTGARRPGYGAAILPIVLFIVAIVCIRQGLQLGFRQGSLPGSGFMPILYGVLLAFCAVPVALAELRGGGTRGPCAKPLLLAAVLALTILGFKVIGGIAALFLMMFGLFSAVERLPVVRSAMVAGIGAALFYVVFVRSLSVALPAGPWGF